VTECNPKKQKLYLNEESKMNGKKLTLLCVTVIAAFAVMLFVGYGPAEASLVSTLALLGMAVTADQLITQSGDERNGGPVAASTTLYGGSLAFWNASGYLESTTSSGANRFAGIVPVQVDNSSGSAGALYSDLLVNGQFLVTGSGFAATSVGKIAYATDNYTVTTTKSASGVMIGKVTQYVSSTTAWVEIDPISITRQYAYQPIVNEFDCETGQGGDTPVVIYPAAMNQNGLVFKGAFGIITEAMAGSSEDQGIITVEDTDGNDLCTLTPSNAAADSIGDIVQSSISVWASATGVAWVTVAAGKGIQAKVTQATSGGSPAGKMKVYLEVQPLL
jgi:hypothetical protein